MISGLQKTTLIDFPDTIACTVFLGGCNFRCGYCYNSDLVFSLPGPTITETSFFEFLEKRKKYLDGVCITGGEPTIHKNLPDFCSKIKKMGYRVKLDTNGSNPKMLGYLIKNKLVDYIAMDIKDSLDDYYEVSQTKVKTENLLESIELIKNSGVDYEFRTTVIPDIIDEKKIEKIGKTIAGAKRFFLQQFMPSEKTISQKYHSMEPLSEKKLESFKQILLKYVKNVEIRSLA